DPSLYAVDATTGKERWRVALGSWVYDTPTVVDGVVYAGTNTFLSDGVFVALDAATGHERWRVKLDGGLEGAPVVAGGTGLLPSAAGTTLLDLDAATGAERWGLDDSLGTDFVPDLPS